MKFRSEVVNMGNVKISFKGQKLLNDPSLTRDLVNSVLKERKKLLAGESVGIRGSRVTVVSQIKEHNGNHRK